MRQRPSLCWTLPVHRRVWGPDLHCVIRLLAETLLSRNNSLAIVWKVRSESKIEVVSAISLVFRDSLRVGERVALEEAEAGSILPRVSENNHLIIVQTTEMATAYHLPSPVVHITRSIRLKSA